MDMPVLALAKNYTNSQRLGHKENRKIINTGNSDAQDIFGNGRLYARISDTPIDPEQVTGFVYIAGDSQERFWSASGLTLHHDSGTYAFTDNSGNLFVFIICVETDGIAPGVYVQSNDVFKIAELHYTIVIKMDEAYLPGTFLPSLVVSEATTMAAAQSIGEWVDFTEDEHTIVEKAASQGLPMIIRFTVGVNVVLGIIAPFVGNSAYKFVFEEDVECEIGFHNRYQIKFVQVTT